jgi:hypothetical protein
VRTLRSAIAGVYPPNLARRLGPAPSDLTSRLGRKGRVSLDVADPGGCIIGRRPLLYRAPPGEALRRREHAGASHATIGVVATIVAVLEVADDGRGSPPRSSMRATPACIDDPK